MIDSKLIKTAHPEFQENPILSLLDLPEFAGKLIGSFPNGAVIGLAGDLGAGKTSLVRACISEIATRRGGKSPEVPSPSFTIHQSFPQLVPPVDHFDLYRLENVDFASLANLGYHDILLSNRSQ